MKLEFKHLAPYLPYGLKVKYQTKSAMPPTIEKVTGIDKNEAITFYDSPNPYKQTNFSYIKPILNPMTSLSKEQIEILSIDLKITIKYSKSKDFLSRMSYWDSIFLLENHFDIFGLIEKGLAISIHDVEQVIT